ncbi:MAG: DUF5069 domain-containing protein [Chthoniobacterales bacterium]
MSTSFPKSPYDKTHGIVYFARMCDKIRLHAKGGLPKDYEENLGKGFDKRCTDFLQVDYADITRLAREGKSDKEIMDWCFAQKFHPTAEQIEVWNGFMTKRGWKDDGSEIFQRRMKEGGHEARTDVETMFGYIDLDEGRNSVK